MKIDAIMTVVGPLYQSYLLRSLKIWLDTLDSLTIATDKPMHLSDADNLRVIVTSAFTDNGAYLNKGKALNEAYAAASPADWALSIDADIVPPANWRETAEAKARPDCINGATRYDASGKYLDRIPPRPIGFFQLWHTADTKSKSSGFNPFNDTYPHAAHYDSDFYEQWPGSHRNNLGIHLVHLGNKTRNWFGVGADPLLTARVLKFCKA